VTASPSPVQLTMSFRLPFSGIQLGYTVIFGWYAAFLFTRTGPANSLFVTENKKIGHLFILAIIVDSMTFLMP
jgi:hypothetical protein